MDGKIQNDRRYRRTHSQIISSAIELAQEIGWEKVTVTMLAKKVDMNRNSFYIHFNTINDVFNEIEDVFINKYRALLAEKPFLEIILRDQHFHNTFEDFLNRESEYVNMILSIGRSDFLVHKIQNIFIEIIENEINSNPRYEKVGDLVLPYFSGWVYIFFSNYVNDVKNFRKRDNIKISCELIEQVLTMIEKDK